jgi:outer membrane protein assembly factor BamD (BamD/ComL family)
MLTRLRQDTTLHLAMYAFLSIFSVTMLESRAPRTFTPQTVTQMTQERLNKPVDKRLLARNALETQGNTKAGDKSKESTPKSSAHKLLSEMTFDEVIVSKDRVMASKNYTSGLKYIERALKLCDDIDEMEKLLLEYSDTLYTCKRYEKASRSYNELANLYPGSDKVEYALYQAIECSSKLILDAERDQTKTQETVDLANQFLQRSDIFTTYKERVEAIKQDALLTLVQSEFNICQFYITSYEYAQAERRLNGIRKDWLSKLPDIEPRILMLECSLAEKQNKPDLITEKKKELQDKFPQATIQLAQNKPRSGFLSWF